MNPKLTVVYDACVLYPNVLRDLLMELAVRDLVRAKWTEQIHREWLENLSRNRPEIPIEKLYRLRDLMNANVRDCLVVDYEALIPTLNLPDSNDRHILAAAIKADAEVIVTTNLKDFPESELTKYKIEAQHQDTFITNLIELYPLQVLEVVKVCQLRRKNPPCSWEQFLSSLLRQQLPNTVLMLKKIRS
ncbi:PIN domain-containing protein [Myxosarcina sp. GI1]|uniref:PIN domain-containing protein n=1 Tax=Myxosarcina sp. GI1 TaxID=1541065 RepID=UPI0005647A10|nr:PIN domain-containing protein [Myxosarcina sp. GI1]